MNLRDLHYLVTTADLLHFGRAAEACHVSQPTLSMQLKKLEGELGVQLFERTNKQVMLTPIGGEVVARARHVLSEVGQMKQLAQNSRDPLAGELRLGLFPTLAPYLLPSLMPKLTAAFPKLDMLLVEEKTPTLIAQLEAGHIDAALLAMPVDSDSLAHAPLFVEPFLLAVATTHALAKRKSVRLDELRNESVLLLEDGHCLRDQALEVCHRLGIGEANHFRATSLETLRHMVAGGNAVTLMPKLATQEDSATLRYIPFAASPPSRHIALYWRKSSARTPLFTAMAQQIRESYKKL